ncbi:MAG: DUF3352 domain-containing protein [Flavobacteriales bacterium]|nr:DUF3352 domain-containing protein [Flavobacteriales bacterium]
MLRKLFFFLVLLAFAGAMAYSYFHFKTIKQPISNSIKAIPTSAALVIELKQIVDTWQKLSKTNLIWQELLRTTCVNDLNESLKYLDSLRKKDRHFDAFLKSQPVFISAHMSGASNFNYLFTIGLPSTINGQDVDNYILESTRQANTSTKQYDGISITSIKSSSSANSFHYAVHDGILSCSYSMILVEDAIRQKQSQNSLLNNTDFSKVMRTSGDKIDANIFINYKVFPSIISSLISPEFQAELGDLTNIANWAEIDLDLVPNAIRLSGYTYANDSANNYLSAWTHQKPQKPTMLKMLPKNISTFIHLGFSDFKLFRKDYKIYLEKNNKLFEYSTALKLVEAKYHINFTTQFLDNIDDEMALAITESNAENYKNGAFAIFKMKDIEAALNAFTALDIAIDNVKNIVRDSIEFKGHIIQQVNLKGMLQVLFGSPFSIITENYYTTIGNYLVLGNSVNNLRDFVNYHARGKTLARDEHFARFMDNLNQNSNILIYSNIAQSQGVYKAFVAPETATDIENNKAMLNKFEGVAIQLSKSKNNLYYNSVYLNHNPIEKRETSSLWEVELDTSTSQKPQLVTNHYSFEKEIFVQDDANTIYLISNTGELLWKRNIAEKIMGNVSQIDIFKNDKLQLLFNTKKAIYLIDRNGKDVSGYPIKLESDAATPLSAMDYDRNRNYRILLPTKNGQVLNFSAAGTKVKGWKYESNGVAIMYPFQHIDIAGKDYIISIDSRGKIHALSRKGEERLSLNNATALSPFFLVETQTLTDSYILTQDTSGAVKVFLDDTKITQKLPDVSLDTRFFYHYNQTDKYILIDDNELRSLDNELKELTYFETDSAITSNASVHRLPNNVTEIGFSSAAANEIYLLNNAGALHNGFPLYGSSPFTIGDLNKDGQLELIVGSKDGHIYAYGLE